MNILVLNSGSSSVKFQLIETSPEQIKAHEDRVLARGAVEKIGTAEAIVSCEVPPNKPTKFSKEILEHRDAIRAVLDHLMDPSDGLIRAPDEIGGVGHRVVHGGEEFTESVIIDEEVAGKIEDAIELAPLHNPQNLKGYTAAKEFLPHCPHVAVFDTSFHQSIEPHAYLYGLPYVFYSRHRIRRYGFHGTSHRYVAFRFAELHGKPKTEFKLVTCHLGNGCSACAIDRGKPIDTSMGFTPLEGLVMGTRSGDLDPAVVLHIMAKEELRQNEVSSLLNKHSGLYGLSGASNDMRALIEAAGEGDQRAKLAIDVFCYRVKKYIGAYLAALNGADAIVFTGGIGENAAPVRAQICESMDALGVALDPAKNEEASGGEMDISAEGARTKVWVIPTNEELLIARDTLRCITGNKERSAGRRA